MSLSGIKEENLTLLLKALKEIVKSGVAERDIKDTWERIGKREQFDSLGFGSLAELKEWIANNPYANL